MNSIFWGGQTRTGSGREKVLLILPSLPLPQAHPSPRGRRVYIYRRKRWGRLKPSSGYREGLLFRGKGGADPYLRDEVKHFHDCLLVGATILEGLGWCRRGLRREIEVLRLSIEQSGISNSQESSGGWNKWGLTKGTEGREPCVGGERCGETKGRWRGHPALEAYREGLKVRQEPSPRSPTPRAR